MGAGTGEVMGVESHPEIIESKYEDVFKLDLDLKPSPLLVSKEEDNPSDFNWGFEVNLLKIFS